MKIKAFIKMIIDIVMTFLMIACMSGLMSGDLLHEVFGSVMTALFILHGLRSNLYFRARRVWRILCVRSSATAQNVTKKISG
jgi:hypothetical protein